MKKTYALTWDSPDAGYYIKVDPKEIPQIRRKLSKLSGLKFQDVAELTLEGKDVDVLIREIKDAEGL